MVRETTAVMHTGGRQALPTIILVVLLALPAYWFLRFDLFPFTDLPNHLAAATIYSHLDDPHTRFGAYFSAEVSGFAPNIAHLVFCALFSSVETGNAVWMVFALVALGAGFAWLFALTGATREFLPLVTLLVFNSNVSWGFVGFSAATPLLVVLLCLHIADQRIPSVRYRLGIGIVCILLFYIHVLAVLFALTFLLLTGLLHAGGAAKRRFAGFLLPGLPALGLLLAWVLTAEQFRDGSTGEFLGTYYRWHYAGSLLPRLSRLLTNDFSVLAGTTASIPWTALFSIALLGGFPALLGKSRIHRLWAEARMVLVFFCLAVACFLLLPDRLPDQAHLYSRFSGLVLGSGLAVIASSRLLNHSRLLLALCTCAALVYLFCWSGYLAEFTARTAGFTRTFLAHAGRDTTVMAGIIRNPEFRTSRPMVHFQNYHIIWNNGITPTRVADYRFGAIRRKPGGKPLPEYQEWVSPEANIGQLLERYADARYILFHGEATIPGLGGGGLRELVRGGEWLLFERSARPCTKGKN